MSQELKITTDVEEIFSKIKNLVRLSTEVSKEARAKLDDQVVELGRTAITLIGDEETKRRLDKVYTDLQYETSYEYQ